MPRFSIVTITYNDMVGLASTIRSVGPQTFRDFEYIVQDGQSTDGTSDVVAGFHDWVDTYNHVADDGIYDAMNKALQSCTGQYTLFLNSSDVFAAPDVLEKANELILAGDEIVHGMSLNLETGHVHEYKRLNDEKFGMTFDHQATFVKTEILKKNEFDTSLQIAGDLDFFCRCKSQNVGFRNIDLLVAKKPFSVGASTDYLERFKERRFVLLNNFPEDEHQIDSRLKSELLEFAESRFDSEPLEERLAELEIEEMLVEFEKLSHTLAEIFELQACVA